VASTSNKAMVCNVESFSIWKLSTFICQRMWPEETMLITSGVACIIFNAAAVQLCCLFLQS